MKGMLFIYGLLAICCIIGLARPHVALIGYYGFAVLIPEWNWRWALPPNPGFQKYLVASCLLGFLFNGLRGNRLRGGPLAACLCFGLYLGLSYVSAASSISPSNSQWFMSFMWKIVLMAAMAVLLLDSPRKISAILWVSVLAQGYNAFRINEQYFETGICWAAYTGWAFMDNNIYCMATMPMIGMSLALAFRSQRIWQRAIAGGIFLLQMHQIMLMQSRGCMLGAIILAGIFFLLVPKNAYSWAAILGSIFAATVLAGPSVVKEFSSSFASAEERDSSADSRFKLWEAGAKITADYPVLGVGPDAGRRIVHKYYPGGLRARDKALHNTLFEVTACSGVPAAVGYFGFFGICWLSVAWFWKREGKILAPPMSAACLAILCGLPGFLVSAMFSSSLLVESPYALVALGCATILVRKAYEDRHQSSSHGFPGTVDHIGKSPQLLPRSAEVEITPEPFRQ